MKPKSQKRAELRARLLQQIKNLEAWRERDPHGYDRHHGQTVLLSSKIQLDNVERAMRRNGELV